MSGSSGADILVDSGGGSWGNRAKSWGGSGNDFIYNEWSDSNMSSYISSARHRSGYFDRAVRKASSGLSSRHEEVLRLKQFYKEKGYSEFKGRIADLVDETPMKPG